MLLLAFALTAAMKPWAPNGNWRMYGNATESCGQWLMRKDDRAFRLGQVSWAGGFISGINLSNGGKLTDTDPESLVAYIDQQCAKQPLETVSGVTFRFFYKLVNGWQ